MKALRIPGSAACIDGRGFARHACLLAAAGALAVLPGCSQPTPSSSPEASSQPIAAAPSPLVASEGRQRPLSPEQRQAGAAYRVMLAAAKADPAHMDWLALRQGYASSPAYDPHVGSGMDMRDINAAGARGDMARVASLSEDAVARNWMNVPAHLAAETAYQRLGNTDGVQRHHLFSQAFFVNALREHDGRTPATAIPVLATAEEYMILAGLRAKRQLQELRRIDGHWFDILTFGQPPGTATGKLYFSIDTMFAREGALVTGGVLVEEDRLP